MRKRIPLKNEDIYERALVIEQNQDRERGALYKLIRLVSTLHPVTDEFGLTTEKVIKASSMVVYSADDQVSCQVFAENNHWLLEKLPQKKRDSQKNTASKTDFSNIEWNC